MTYWEKRQQQLNKQLEKDEAKLKERLSSFYDAEFRKLERQIAAYYTQYGEDSVIEYRKLMESLPAEDRRLLMEQMDAFAKKYPEYAHLMPVRESIYKLNRLEGLQYSILMQQYEIGAANIEQITDHLNRQALRAANAAAESLGFGKNFYAANADIIKKFVDVPWADGKNFSTRIWGNTEKLANYLNTDIAQAFARGDSYDRIVSNLKKRFEKVTRNDAYRLVYTEGTYVMAEATMTPFESEFEQYRVSTVGDGKVCDICREVAKETFQIKDRTPGVNFPPLHAWCRCSFTVEVADWDAWMEDYELRHGNGQARKVKNRLKSDIGKPGFITPENIEDFKDIGIDEYIAKEIEKLPENHLDYLNGYIERFIIDDKLNSRFDRERKILYLRSDPIEGELIHELGHVLETKSGLIYTDRYREIRENGMGQISIFRIRRGKQYEYVENEKFVSRYQGMLYEQDNNGYKSRKRDGYINLECLGEYFSEGYREYFINPENLKRKDPELFEYIRILKLK